MYFADKALGSPEGAPNIEALRFISVEDGKLEWANFLAKSNSFPLRLIYSFSLLFFLLFFKKIFLINQLLFPNLTGMFIWVCLIRRLKQQGQFLIIFFHLSGQLSINLIKLKKKN